MTAPRPKPVRRRIVSTILWTLTLLLLTNVGWSVWAAWASDQPWSLPWSVPTMKGMQGQRTGFAMTSHGVWMSDHENTNLYAGTFQSTRPKWAESYWTQHAPPVNSQKVKKWYFESTGCPMRLLWVGWEDTHSGFRRIASTGLAIAESNAKGQRAIVLPIRPILTGQAFYAAFWLAIVIAVPFTRHRFRTWRGCCTNCNYDLRANTTGVCSECGTAIPTHTPS